MLGWLFKRSKDKAPAPATTPVKPQTTAPRPAPVATPAEDRTADLEAARGDDEALLALVRQAGVPLPIKLAAVEAIDSEAALQQAERELRSRDRRVHQLAKQRLRSKSSGRRTREEAARLLVTARGLAEASQVGINRIVELDRAWQALDASVIDAADRDEFTALTAQLAAGIRERADLDLQRRRWQAEAVEVARQLRAAGLAAAEGGQVRAALGAAIDAARGVLDRMPAGDSAGAAGAAVESAASDLRQMIERALALDEHLAVLDRLLAMGDEAPDSAQQPDAAEAPDAAEPSDAAEPASTVPARVSAEVGAAAPVEDPERVWQALVPLPDAQWAALLKARHARWLQARRSARHDRQTWQREQKRGEDNVRRLERQREQQLERESVPLTALTEIIERSEKALDDGRLNEAQRELSRFDSALRGHDAPEPLRARLQAARARLAQLRGWQHWAGSQARDELVLQAEALAAATLGGTGAVSGASGDASSMSPDSGDSGGPGGLGDAGESVAPTGSNESNESHEAGSSVGSADEGGSTQSPISDAAAEVARLSLRQRADIIDTLRARWKEIDRHGNAGSQALWRRFDAALKTAYEPVAAQVAAQRAARQANLQARWQLLKSLEALGGTEASVPPIGAAASAAGDAVVAPTDDVAAAPARNAADAPAGAAAVAPASEPTVADAAGQPPDGCTPNRTPPDPRTLADALFRFHTEWRKLGPVQHTVPRAEQASLNARMQSAVSRVEEPLQAARSRARSEREALVARARALAGEMPSRGRDAVAEVRALQAEWQQHARGLPLARADEQALWTDFKAATDAVFEARQAAFNEREAEFEANAAERVELIERLRVDPDKGAALQRRLLAEVEAAWQRCGPAPRARAAALDAEFRAAREALLQWLGNTAQREWQAVCDALDTKLALCTARERAGSVDGTEAGVAGDPATLSASWQALPVLPTPFEEALRRRAGLSPAADAGATSSTDDLLLQIETAWDLPTPPPFEAARRERKLLAMKAALEGRRQGAADSSTPEEALAQVVGRSDLDAGQRERLEAVLARWRRDGAKGSSRP